MMNEKKGWNGWYYPARLWLLLMLSTLMMIIGLACVTTLHVTLLLDDGSWHETTRECGKYLCVFSEMSSFSQKCGKCDFLLKIPGSYFTRNFSPQKSNIEGWQKTNRKCRKCCGSFPFWYRPNYRWNFHLSCFPFSIFFSFSSFTLTYVSGFCPGNECWHCCAIRGQSRQTFTCDHKNFETKKELEER